MKLKVKLYGIAIGLVVVSVSTILLTTQYKAKSINSIGIPQSEPNVVAPQEELERMAQEAINAVYESVTVIATDKERGIVVATINNPTNYKFSSLMVHMQLAGEDDVFLHEEVEFLLDGLSEGESKNIIFVTEDPSVFEGFKRFNFYVEGF